MRMGILHIKNKKIKSRRVIKSTTFIYTNYNNKILENQLKLKNKNKCLKILIL